MTARGIVRSVAVVFGAAALWGVPVTGAQAVGYHPNPPRQTPAPPRDGSGPQGQGGSNSQQASSGSNRGTPEGCFRRYDERCERARENRRDHPQGAAN